MMHLDLVLMGCIAISVRIEREGRRDSDNSKGGAVAARVVFCEVRQEQGQNIMATTLIFSCITQFNHSVCLCFRLYG